MSFRERIVQLQRSCFSGIQELLSRAGERDRLTRSCKPPAKAQQQCSKGDGKPALEHLCRRSKHMKNTHGARRGGGGGIRRFALFEDAAPAPFGLAEEVCQHNARHQPRRPASLSLRRPHPIRPSTVPSKTSEGQGWRDVVCRFCLSSSTTAIAPPICSPQLANEKGASVRVASYRSSGASARAYCRLKLA